MPVPGTHSGTDTPVFRPGRSTRLAVTGGTDFHGKNKEGVDLLTGYGSLRIPYRLLEELKRFQPGRKP